MQAGIRTPSEITGAMSGSVATFIHMAHPTSLTSAFRSAFPAAMDTRRSLFTDTSHHRRPCDERHGLHHPTEVAPADRPGDRQAPSRQTDQYTKIPKNNLPYTEL